MYAVNGVPLNNAGRGWVFRSGSIPFSALEAKVSTVHRQGRDGALTIPGSLESPVWKMIVNTPPAGLESLNALFARRPLKLTKVGDSTREVSVTLLTSEVIRVFPAAEYVDMAYYVSLDDAAWRSSSVSTSAAVTLGAASVPVNGLFPGLSAPVQDALVRVKGAVTGLQVTDSSGAWFTYGGTLTASQYLRFDAATGRAWVTGGDTWTGGTEVSGQIDYGGPRRIFEVTPFFTDPAVREGRLTVATASRTSASVQVRGRGAFLV